jgi:hypothetical protein
MMAESKLRSIDEANARWPCEHGRSALLVGKAAEGLALPGKPIASRPGPVCSLRPLAGRRTGEEACPRAQNWLLRPDGKAPHAEFVR